MLVYTNKFIVLFTLYDQQSSHMMLYTAFWFTLLKFLKKIPVHNNLLNMLHSVLMCIRVVC